MTMTGSTHPLHPILNFFRRKAPTETAYKTKPQYDDHYVEYHSDTEIVVRLSSIGRYHIHPRKVRERIIRVKI